MGRNEFDLRHYPDATLADWERVSQHEQLQRLAREARKAHREADIPTTAPEPRRRTRTLQRVALLLLGLRTAS